jgi:hypothetical protein
MLPAFLLPERTASEDGRGAHVALDQPHTHRLELTLGITRIRERESLDVHVCGSSDGEHWKPLATFPRKSFCGTYHLKVDLSRHRDVKYLRAEWQMRRWNAELSKPVFSFYVWAESQHLKALQAAS